MSDKPSPTTIHVSDYVPDMARLTHMLYVDIETQIQRADIKAQIILSANAILMAFVANFGLGVTFETIRAIRPIELGVIAADALMMMAILISVYFALSTAYPRVGTRHRQRGSVAPVDDSALFYSGYIVQIARNEYVTRFMDLSLQDVKRAIAEQIHAKSTIVERKFKQVQISMISIFVAIVMWTASRILLYFT
jgi:hypothetical protein